MTMNPLLFQINTRVLLRELGARSSQPTTLDDIDDELLDAYRGLGFDWLYLLGVWQTGEAARQVSLSQPGLREEYLRTLPDFKEEDVAGSGFAITGYQVLAKLGGDAAMLRLRERMQRSGLKLMLDFVPNHTAPDHPWASEHPEYFVRGNPADLAAHPENFTRLGETIFAYGRDPYFSGWPDTLQLDYSRPEAVEVMLAELRRAARLCDGLRCDMAMLVLPQIFERTWGRPALPFWTRGIPQVKAEQPGFTFMAEVYWDMEADLLAQGFDYAYDKRLYDRLREGSVRGVREHLRAGPDYLARMVHFLENHDEQRAAAVFPPERYPAAAALAYLVPGLRFFHQGQLEGRRVKVSVHLGRGPRESGSPEVMAFHRRLLGLLRDPLFREGQWRLVETDVETCLAFVWKGQGEALVLVNYGPRVERCCVKVEGQALRDWFGEQVVEVDEAGRACLEMKAWEWRVFTLG